MKVFVYAAGEIYEVTEAHLSGADSLHVECNAVSPDGDRYTETGYGSTFDEALNDLRRRLEGGA